MTERLSGAVIVVTANLDGQQHTGAISLRKNFELERELTRDFVIGPTGEIGARVLDLGVDTLSGDTDGARLRRPYTIDAGGGRVAYDIRATLSPTEYNGSHLQIGDTGDPGQLTATDATGAPGRDQADVALRYLAQSTTDSVNPARLHVGHYHDGTYSEGGEAGLFGAPLKVYIPNARPITTADEPSSVELSVTAVPVGTLTDALDAAEQLA